MGKKDARAFFWLIGGLFIYVLFGNLVSILPGGLPPTDNFSSNLALGLTVFVVFNVAGLARNGVHYVKHLLGPVWWLAPLMLVVEVIGLCVRPVSLSLRLMGNIYGDHTVFGIMSDLVPVVIPSIFLGLGIFVSFVQAFVFTLLTCVYVSLAVAHEEGH
jgi:F-type H+-transporting ATPase subunit a